MKINFKRIDHILICIPLGKEAEARAFYIDILGLKEIPKPKNVLKKGGFWLQAANIELHIGVEDFETKSDQHPAFEITNLEAVKSYLKGLNVRVKEYENLPTFRRFSFFDPFNNRIELLEKI